jgi:hypothetical protein
VVRGGGGSTQRRAHPQALERHQLCRRRGAALARTALGAAHRPHAELVRGCGHHDAGPPLLLRLADPDRHAAREVRLRRWCGHRWCSAGAFSASIAGAYRAKMWPGIDLDPRRLIDLAS